LWTPPPPISPFREKKNSKSSSQEETLFFPPLLTLRLSLLSLLRREIAFSRRGLMKPFLRRGLFCLLFSRLLSSLRATGSSLPSRQGKNPRSGSLGHLLLFEERLFLARRTPEMMKRSLFSFCIRGSSISPLPFPASPSPSRGEVGSPQNGGGD